MLFDDQADALAQRARMSAAKEHRVLEEEKRFGNGSDEKIVYEGRACPRLLGAWVSSHI